MSCVVWSRVERCGVIWAWLGGSGKEGANRYRQTVGFRGVMDTGGKEGIVSRRR